MESKLQKYLSDRRGCNTMTKANKTRNEKGEETSKEKKRKAPGWEPGLLSQVWVMCTMDLYWILALEGLDQDYFGAG